MWLARHYDTGISVETLNRIEAEEDASYYRSKLQDRIARAEERTSMAEKREHELEVRMAELEAKLRQVETDLAYIERQEYQSPAITEYGTLVELTQGSGVAPMCGSQWSD